MKKTVLFVAHERMINGASHSMLNLIDSLIDKCNFVVVSPYKDGPFIEEAKDRSIDIYYVPFSRWVELKDDSFKEKQSNWNKINRNNQKLAKEFCKILKDNNTNIDIIHSNTSVVDFGYRVSKILNKPHIWHIREFGEKDFSMYPLCSYKKYYKDIANNNYLVCVSNEVKKKFEEYVDKDKLITIYNGVSKININDGKNYHLKKNSKLICLQSGMISKTKGQDITINAIDKLIKKGLNIELLIAGSGNILDLGITTEDKKWLKILGQVNNLNEIRKNVDIEIVSSKSEAFGRITVEAMMGGITVVGSNSGGTKELIENYKTGILFKKGDSIDLADKIEYLYNNRELIKDIGQNAYNYSKDYFLIDRCANEIYDLYCKIKK